MMKKTYQEISYYFKKIHNFGLLPVVYQNKIIHFFLEDRHYMVDGSDVKDFLETGSQFAEFVTLKDIEKFCKTNKPKGILACKRVWTSLEWFCDWGDKLKSISKDNTLIIFLTHSFELPSDMGDEWYIVSF